MNADRSTFHDESSLVIRPPRSHVVAALVFGVFFGALGIAGIAFKASHFPIPAPGEDGFFNFALIASFVALLTMTPIVISLWLAKYRVQLSYDSKCFVRSLFRTREFDLDSIRAIAFTKDSIRNHAFLADVIFPEQHLPDLNLPIQVINDKGEKLFTLSDNVFGEEQRKAARTFIESYLEKKSAKGPSPPPELRGWKRIPPGTEFSSTGEIIQGRRLGSVLMFASAALVCVSFFLYSAWHSHTMELAAGLESKRPLLVGLSLLLAIVSAVFLAIPAWRASRHTFELRDQGECITRGYLRTKRFRFDEIRDLTVYQRLLYRDVEKGDDGLPDCSCSLKLLDAQGKSLGVLAAEWGPDAYFRARALLTRRLRRDSCA